jgi:hypothetical protein
MQVPASMVIAGAGDAAWIVMERPSRPPDGLLSLNSDYQPRLTRVNGFK